MKQLTSKKWWEAAGTRAIKTMAQSLISTVGVSAAAMSEVNWLLVVSSSVLAGVLSLCTSIAGLPEVKEEGE